MVDNDIKDLEELAEKNIKDILNICIKHDDNHNNALVVYDTNNGLTDILTAAYKKVLPNATFIDFDKSSKEDIIKSFDNMKSQDLVILIQSTNFLLNEFRIRLHLFNKNLKVVEHMHLARNTRDTWSVYINSLEYDTAWYPVIAPKLKDKLDNTKILKISSNFDIDKNAKLIISGELEPAKLNIGDYSDMANVGGTFPIGEVFTEAKNFENMNGEVYIYAFAGADFNINMHEPFKIKIEKGIVTSWADNTPQSFIDIINLIKQYERPLIREIGFGLNKAITKEKYLNDITAFERILGMHLSLGEKHSVYKKEGLATKKTKFHVDLFPVVDLVTSDAVEIFKNNIYQV